MAKMNLRAGKVAIKIIILFAIPGLIFFSDRLLTPVKAAVPLRVNWNNYGDNRSWDNQDNWETGAVPTADDKAAIRNSAVSGPIIDASTTAVVEIIVVGDYDSINDTVDITGGSLTTDDWFIIGYGTGNDIECRLRYYESR